MGRPCRANALDLLRLCWGLPNPKSGSSAISIMSFAFQHQDQLNSQSAHLVSEELQAANDSCAADQINYYAAFDGRVDLADHIGAVGPTSQAAVTLITAYDPVTKHFSLSDGNQLQKRTSAQLSEADLLVRTFASLEGFGDLLHGLNPNQCVAYGLPPDGAECLVTKAAHERAGCPAISTPRTEEAFTWPTGPGILMLDYDPPKSGTALTREELFAALHAACPTLAQSDALWMPSTSSEIYNMATGEQLAGIKGQRIYFMLANATDIPRTGKALLTHLWALGHGRYEVSSSGQMLERGLFDASVWQTNRIDFAGGASCDAPLVQRRGTPLLIKGAQRLVNSPLAVLDPPDEIVKAADHHKSVARNAVAAESARKREAWKQDRAESIKVTNPELTQEAISTLVDLAVNPERRRLMGAWPIIVVDDHGNESSVSVDEILEAPEKYHLMLTLDPLEPDYDGRRPVGKLYLSGQPRLHSFAHGGATFTLSSKVVRIEMYRGRERDAVDSLLQVMRTSPEIFDFGTAVVKVRDGKAINFSQESLRYWTAGVVQFCRTKTAANGQVYDVLEDPPHSICKTVLAMPDERAFKPLHAIITAPTLRKDGTVLSNPGYDPTSGLVLHIADDATIAIPMAPTEAQARKALETLWFPFANFPFVDNLAKAAHLAALLTAAVRASLPTAPAFGYDAPVQGSGKTLLAQCAAALATGSPPVLYPHITGSDDGEMRKRLFSALLAGQRTIVLDNILGSFDSVALASMLTSEFFQDRKLGKSESPSVPTGALVLLTGNNMMLAGDMPRRVVPCRIDPQTETPFDRSFSVEPLSYCLVNRQKMIVAALTLIRYYLSANVSRPAPGRMASFEMWDDWVRQTVVYVDQTIAPGQFGDVMDLIKKNQAEDPAKDTLRDLLQALYGCFENRVFTASEVASACLRGSLSESNEGRLHEAVLAVSTSPKITSGSVGKALANRKERICDGMRLTVVSDNKNGRMWRVVGRPD